MRNAFKILAGISYIGGEGKIILKVILKTQGMRTWIGFIWLGIKSKRWVMQHGNHTIGFTIGRTFLERMSDYQIRTNNSVPQMIQFVVKQHNRQRLRNGRCEAQAVSAGFSRRIPGFVPTSVLVGFLVAEVAMGQVFLGVPQFSRVSIIPLLLSIHSCVILGLDKGSVRRPFPQRHTLPSSQQ